MRKEITIAILLLAIAATPVFAQSSHGNHGDDNKNVQSANANHDNDNTDNVHQQTAVLGIQSKNDADDHNITPTVVPTGTQTTTPTVSVSPCDENETNENHGKFVSCVAHLHLGGKVVSEAAHDKIHEKDNDEHPSVTPTTAVSPTPSATPSSSPTPSISISPTPITSTSATLEDDILPFKKLQTLINQLASFFRHLI